jgi:PKD domain/Right handed beta helix region
MLRHRVAASAAFLVCACSVSVVIPAAAHAAAGSAMTFHVNKNGCSDQTTDSSVEPYCTIQAAVNAATSPGDTVIVAANTNAYAPFTVPGSGTAAAPITIEGSTAPIKSSATNLLAAVVAAPSGSSTAAVSVSGASYVDIENLRVSQNATDVGLAVSRSSNVVVSGVDESLPGFVSSMTPQASMAISGDSSDVTVERDRVLGDSTAGALDIQGGSGDVVTTSQITDGHGSAIAVSQSTGADITGNRVPIACGAGISLTGGSTGANVQNNYVASLSDYPQYCVPSTTPSDENALLVDASSTSGTVADYNDLLAGYPSIPNLYSWGGASYPTAADFTAAAGQGAHDTSGSAAAAIVDSANSDAPGELPIDLYGHPRVDDPLVPNTGAGTYSYYDRGPIEVVDSLTVSTTSDTPTTAPVGASANYGLMITDNWGNAVTSCTYTFGDGTPAVTVPAASNVCTEPHTFTALGNHVVSVVVQISDGYSTTSDMTVDTVAVSPFTAELALTDYGFLGVTAATSASTDDWNITNCTVDFGDGQTATGCGASHTYKTPGTYTVKLTETDVDGNQATASQQFSTVGTFYTPVTPTRILDTRKGLGVIKGKVAPVAPDSVLQLHVDGVGGIPATGVDAVALNLTAVDGTRNGYITAFSNDASGLPKVSNLNFSAGQTVANTVIVAVAPDGIVNLITATPDNGGSTTSATGISNLNYFVGKTISNEAMVRTGSDGVFDLTNSGNGSVDVIVDLSGYFTPGAGAAFQPIDPTRYLDTRSGVGQIVGGATPKTVASDGIVGLETDVPCPGWPGNCTFAGPMDTPVAVAANVTVVQPTANGYLTVYPYGASTPPLASALDFSTGQTVANAVTVGVDQNQYAFDMYNGSKGGIQLVADIFGYYED